MTDIFYLLNDYIWNPRLWLPHNYTWADVEKANAKQYIGRPRDLLYSFLTGIAMFFCRIFIERFIWEPIGKFYGLKHRKYYKPAVDEELEKEYDINKRPNSQQIKELSQKIDRKERYLQIWFRRRRNINKSDILTKFSESGWRFVYYLSIFIVGCWVLSDQPFVRDTKQMWDKVPFNHITPYMFWYIMVELGYYWSSLFTIFYDVKRKDFLQMLVHHLATISLIVLAWIQNFIPVSLYILCLHDFVDYFMEAAKMMKYIKKDIPCKILFFIFTVAWFVSRLLFYPVKILYSTIYEKPFNYFGSIVCQIFLSVLQVLHVLWFIMILRIAFQALDDTGIHKDSRSDSEMSDTDNESNRVSPVHIKKNLDSLKLKKI